MEFRTVKRMISFSWIFIGFYIIFANLFFFWINCLEGDFSLSMLLDFVIFKNYILQRNSRLYNYFEKVGKIHLQNEEKKEESAS